MRTREILAQAKKDGKYAGKRAASWVFDGNTNEETYRRFLKGIEDGDPMVLDSVNEPNLSGEYAGDPTSQSLAEEYGLDQDDARYEWLSDKMCTAWEEASSNAFWWELERVCRYQLAK